MSTIGVKAIKYPDGDSAINITDGGNVTLAGTLGVTGVLTATSLDISGDIDVDGTTNLDAVDIDGNVNISGQVTLFNNLSLQDDDILQLGSSQDLKIYHNGTHSYIDDTGTGRLYLRGNDRVQIQKYTGEDMITCLADGAVKLYHDNANKLETTSSGVAITGGITSTSRHDVNFNGGSTQAFKYTDTGGGNLASFGQFYNTSNALIGNVQNANNDGIHLSLKNGSIVFNNVGYTAANALDDYEEGTWTPVLEGSGTTSGVTYSRRQGSYTKVGNSVFVNFHIVLSSEGTIGSTAKISGLPFSGNGAPLYQVCHIMSGNMALDKDQTLTGMQFAANAFIYLMKQESDLALSQITGNGSFKNNSEMVGMCTYYTNS